MNTSKKIIGLLFFCFFLSNTSVKAQEGFIGEIRMFAGNFAPRTWAFCEGQLLSISQNQALFSIIGCQYGGDCRTSFALPDLRGRVAMGAGTGPGLTTRTQAQMLGSENRILTILNLPVHNHTAAVSQGSNTSHVQLSTDNAVRKTPDTGDVPAVSQFGSGLGATDVRSYGPAVNTVNGQEISGSNPPNVTIGNTGGSQSFQIIQPSTVIRYIICLDGVFPSRS